MCSSSCYFWKMDFWGPPGCLEGTFTFHAGVCSIPSCDLRSHMLTKKAEHNPAVEANTLTNSIEAFKMVHIRKKKRWTFPSKVAHLWGGRISELFWRSHQRLASHKDSLRDASESEHFFQIFNGRHFQKYLSYTIPSGNLQSLMIFAEKVLLHVSVILSTEWLKSDRKGSWGGEGRRWGFLSPTWAGLTLRADHSYSFQGLFKTEASPRLRGQVPFPCLNPATRLSSKPRPAGPRTNKCLLLQLVRHLH